MLIIKAERDLTNEEEIANLEGEFEAIKKLLNQLIRFLKNQIIETLEYLIWN